jgi:hypothetical protein
MLGPLFRRSGWREDELFHGSIEEADPRVQQAYQRYLEHAQELGATWAVQCVPLRIMHAGAGTAMSAAALCIVTGCVQVLSTRSNSMCYIRMQSHVHAACRSWCPIPGTAQRIRWH